MGRPSSFTAFEAIKLILRPVIVYCLKRSVGLQDLYEAAKVVFLEVAIEQMKANGERVSVSRLNSVTGVDRRVAARILKQGEVKVEATQYAARVISQWRRDKRFITKSGKPKVLSYQGEKSEFFELVSLVTNSIYPSAILYDLQRLGAVKETRRGLKLTAKAYTPRGNPRRIFEMLSEDVEDIILGVNENVYGDDEEAPNYHATVIFDNIAETNVPEIRTWLDEQCGNFHLRVEQHLAKYDLDMSPDKSKTGGKRIALGLFTRTKD